MLSGNVDDDGTEEAITSGSCSYASSAQFVQVYSFPGTQPKLLTGWIPSAIYKEGVEALSFADGRIVIGWADAGIETFAWTGKGFAKVANVSASKKANPKTTVVSFRKGTTKASLKARTVNGAARFELNFRAGQFLLLTTDNHFGAFPTVEFEDPNGNFIPLVAYHVWADEGFLQAVIKVPKSGPTRVTVRGLPQDKLYLFDFEAFNKPPAWFANYPQVPVPD